MALFVLVTKNSFSSRPSDNYIGSMDTKMYYACGGIYIRVQTNTFWVYGPCAHTYPTYIRTSIRLRMIRMAILVYTLEVPRPALLAPSSYRDGNVQTERHDHEHVVYHVDWQFPVTSLSRIILRKGENGETKPVWHTGIKWGHQVHGVVKPSNMNA